MTTLRAPLALRRRPLVSVVVPHFNYGQYLPTAVASALAQDGVDVEVIVVDDASTDGSLDVARAVARSDPRVTLVEHPRNLRHIRTYNDGLGRARGDYVVLLSADDALAPNALTRAAAVFEHDPGIGLVYGRVDSFEQELPAYRPARSWWTVWEGEEWIGHFVRRGRNLPTNPEVVMRRSVYESTGGYDLSLPRSADMYMWLQAGARGRIGRVNGPVQAYYRLHAENMHRTVHGGLLDEAESVLAAFDRFFEVEGRLLHRPVRLDRRARVAVARELALASALLPAGAEGAEARSAFLDLARRTHADVVRTPGWRWAVLAGRSDRGVRRAVDVVESVRWKIRGKVLSELGV
jgi:hypothetical protein